MKRKSMSIFLQDYHFNRIMRKYESLTEKFDPMREIVEKPSTKRFFSFHIKKALDKYFSTDEDNGR